MREEGVTKRRGRDMRREGGAKGRGWEGGRG